MESHLVSVIIPVFNAANHLERCLNCLKTQTYRKDVELIFINDSSTDSSLAILNKFKEQNVAEFRKIVIISHDKNQGVACARNSGLGAAIGEYIYYLDADDFLVDQGIELLVKQALASNSDIVGCNWVLQFEQNGRKMEQPEVKTPAQAIAFMSKGIMRWNLWLFLVKRELYVTNNINFQPNLNMGEDLLVMFKLLLHANSISMIKDPIYYYSQSNTQSLTRVYSARHKREVEENLRELDRYFLERDTILNWPLLFNFLKLNIKLPLLISSSTTNYREWFMWMEESNVFCLKNDLISKRIRIVQYFASKKLYLLVKLHYYVVIKIVYGIIYK